MTLPSFFRLRLQVPLYTLVLAVVLLAVAAAAFRVSTAPERIRQRHAVAESVCKAKGWQWVHDGRDRLCLEPEAGPR